MSNTPIKRYVVTNTHEHPGSCGAYRGRVARGEELPVSSSSLLVETLACPPLGKSWAFSPAMSDSLLLLIARREGRAPRRKRLRRAVGSGAEANTQPFHLMLRVLETTKREDLRKKRRDICGSCVWAFQTRKRARLLIADWITSIFCWTSSRCFLAHPPPVPGVIPAPSTSVQPPKHFKQQLRWLASALPPCPCVPSRPSAGKCAFPAVLYMRDFDSKPAKQRRAFLSPLTSGRFWGHRQSDSNDSNRTGISKWW